MLVTNRTLVIAIGGYFLAMLMSVPFRNQFRNITHNVHSNLSTNNAGPPGVHHNIIPLTNLGCSRLRPLLQYVTS
uniref:Uncharacterized protein n=1 Tax=Anguilla anguilla TaxID=7936 RepID=A0A0E9W211_ANGAN